MRYWDGVRWTDQYQPRSSSPEGVAPSTEPQGGQWWPEPESGGRTSAPSVADSGIGMRHASFVSRAGASVVDSIIVYAAAFALGATLASLIYALYGDVDDTTFLVVIDIVVFPLLFGLYWWYYTVGWSPGRALVGIRIVDDRGGAPGARRGIGRLLVSVISGLVVGVGYLAMLWSPNNQTWHDAAAGTYVVRVR
jgi:uncharacterized RDD family membrane protein YckC